MVRRWPSLALGGGHGSVRGAAGDRRGAARGGVQAAPVRHVFVIMLENEDYASTFGDPAADPYLAQTLPATGALLENYYATGHESNDNYISLVSGQPPNAQNQADCPLFDNFTGALHAAQTASRAAPAACTRREVQNIGTQLCAAETQLEGVRAGHGQRSQP